MRLKLALKQFSTVLLLTAFVGIATFFVFSKDNKDVTELSKNLNIKIIEFLDSSKELKSVSFKSIVLNCAHLNLQAKASINNLLKFNSNSEFTIELFCFPEDSQIVFQISYLRNKNKIYENYFRQKKSSVDFSTEP